MSSDPGTGGRIGGRIAGVVADASLKTRLAAAPTMSRIALQTINQFVDQIGREAQGTSGEVWKRLIDTGRLPKWAEQTTTFAVRHRGEWAALLNTSAISGGIGNALFDLINNELAPATNYLISKNPNGILDPATAAQAYARNIAPFAWAYEEAARGAINDTRFDILRGLSEATPDLVSLHDMLNRGLIDEERARKALSRLGLPLTWHTILLAMRYPRFTVDQLTHMVTFGTLTEEQGAERARQWGVDARDFRLLVNADGQPPSVTDLLEARRRGIIDDDRLARGIEQGPVRNEWTDVLRKLSLGPPSADAAIGAASQNLLPAGEARQIVAENGIDPKHFPWLLKSAGRPLSIEEAAQLFYRGKLSKQQARQMFLESTLKNEYVDYVFDLFERVLPMDNVRMAYRDGVINKSEALRKLMDLGFSRTNATILVEQAHAQKNAHTRDLSVSVIQELYDARAVTETQAVEWLGALGYDDDEARWLLVVLDLRRAHRLRDQATGVIRSRYVARRIDINAASTALDSIGVPPDQRDLLLGTWEVERDVVTQRLTPTQVTQAVKRGILDPQQATDRLIAYGYDPGDAQVLLALALPAAAP